MDNLLKIDKAKYMNLLGELITLQENEIFKLQELKSSPTTTEDINKLKEKLEINKCELAELIKEF